MKHNKLLLVIFSILLAFTTWYIHERTVDAGNVKDHQNAISATESVKATKKAEKKKEKKQKKKKQDKKKKLKKPEKRKITMGRFKLTGYCPCYECSEGWGRKTHSGAYAESNHTVAADLSVLNLGDWITIDGKKYKVEDSGGAVKGDTIDIFFDTHEEVEEFGVRYGNVNLWRY